MAYPRNGSSSTVSRSNWNIEMLVFVEGGNPENPAKTAQRRDKSQPQTQPTYAVNSRILALLTFNLVGGELYGKHPSFVFKHVP